MKNKRIVLIFVSLLLVFTLSSCTANEGNLKPDGGNIQGEVEYPLVFKDYYERETILEKKPERIISVAPNITEIICALGKQDKLVGRTDYCDYPPAVLDIESVGNIDQPSVEKIVELRPDLLITSSIFQKEALEKLEEVGIKVIILRGEEDFEGLYGVIGDIALLLDAKDKSDELIAKMQENVEQVKNKVAGLDRPEVYYVVGYGEFGDFTAGGDTFIAKMIEMAGGINIANDVEGWSYNIESLLEADPDMLICSKYYDSKDGIINTEGYKELTAVKGGRIFEIDNNKLDRQGPRLADGLIEMAQIIHPEAFAETEK